MVFQQVYHREYLHLAMGICNEGYNPKNYKIKHMVRAGQQGLEPNYSMLYSQNPRGMLVSPQIEDAFLRGDLQLNEVWPELAIRNVSVTKAQADEVIDKCFKGIEGKSKDNKVIRSRYKHVTIKDREIIFSKSFRQHKSAFISNLFLDHKTIKDREEHYKGFYKQLKNRTLLPVVELLKPFLSMYKPNDLLVGWFEASFLMWVSKAYPSQQVETQLIGNEGAKLVYFVLTDEDYESSVSTYFPRD